MGWEVNHDSSMKIRLGDGFQTSTRGRCKEIEVDLGDFKVKCSPHLFELGGPDMVLGIEWLETLGDTIVNWTKQTMSFWSNRKWVTLQGRFGGGLAKHSKEKEELYWRDDEKLDYAGAEYRREATTDR
jgi:hypothetical protein